jgi:hypothetical protein
MTPTDPDDYKIYVNSDGFKIAEVTSPQMVAYAVHDLVAFADSHRTKQVVDGIVNRYEAHIRSGQPAAHQNLSTSATAPNSEAVVVSQLYARGRSWINLRVTTYEEASPYPSYPTAFHAVMGTRSWVLDDTSTLHVIASLAGQNVPRTHGAIMSMVETAPEFATASALHLGEINAWRAFRDFKQRWAADPLWFYHRVVTEAVIECLLRRAERVPVL